MKQLYRQRQYALCRHRTTIWTLSLGSRSCLATHSLLRQCAWLEKRRNVPETPESLPLLGIKQWWQGKINTEQTERVPEWIMTDWMRRTRNLINFCPERQPWKTKVEWEWWLMLTGFATHSTDRNTVQYDESFTFKWTSYVPSSLIYTFLYDSCSGNTIQPQKLLLNYQNNCCALKGGKCFVLFMNKLVKCMAHLQPLQVCAMLIMII